MRNSTIETLYQHYLRHPQVSTDTRNIQPGSIFFALKGERFDANTFTAQALEAGAAYVVIDNPDYHLDQRCVLVPDVLTALQDLARHHRAQLSIPFIGLTGTNGKTTTKELIKAVLAEKYQTFATRGNLNNHIGVPLSILAIQPGTEIAVIEMGANHQQEIAFLSNISRPTHGLITNVGMAHLEGFGGFEGVKKGKGELYTHLKEHHGTALIHRDNPYLLEMAAGAGLSKIIYYGTEPTDTVCGELLEADPFIKISWHTGADLKTGTADTQKHTVQLNLTGAYNFENILAAITIGQLFGLSPGQISKGLSGYQPQNNRSQLTQTANNTIICDFYNANPSSMSAALKNVTSQKAARKAIIIGDMFELGEEAPGQHERIAREAVASGVDLLVLIGTHFFAQKDKPGFATPAGKKILFFESPEEAGSYLSANPLKNHLILLKGSRGMALEKLLPLL